MYKLIYLIPLIFMSQAYANELKEFGCEALHYENDSTELKRMFLHDFRMLDYNTNNEFIKFYPSEGIKITAIRCERSSIVPNKYDYMAVEAGYPFYILSDERVLVIELVKGQFRIRHLSGEGFTENEKKEISKRLNFFQSQIQNKSNE